jgi:EAL domain-containing protein (putative c-di-GMP-specific phosphodiesterase class I)
MNTRALERMALEGRLRRAMDRGEFRLHYQPIVDLETGSVPRVEALVRWQDPERGLLNAGAFVPTAEESGLIVTLGEWVLRTAARQLVAWQRTTCPGLKIAVNLSARQFEQRSLPQAIHDILDETGLAPEHLELEITESIAARDVEWTTDALLRLRARGTSISLDDFSFVRDLGRGSENEAIVRAVIALAHSLKLRVVAEGVETEEQMTFLRDAGCEELQGFLFGHAVPAADLPALVESLSSSLGRRSP